MATNETAALFDAANAPLTEIITSVDASGWDAPSPCTDWAARDVIAHLIDTQRDFFARFEIDLGEAPSVDDPAAAWAAHVAAVRPHLDDDAFIAREYDGYFGPTTVGETLRIFYISDLISHRWDLARAVGGDDILTDTELDFLDASFDYYKDAAYSPGIYEAPIDVPDDADRQTKVLARMGRQA